VRLLVTSSSLNSQTSPGGVCCSLDVALSATLVRSGGLYNINDTQQHGETLPSVCPEQVSACVLVLFELTNWSR